jgi:hypothetical protein
MKKLAAFIMAGRLQAVTAAVGFLALALVLPPFAVLSGAAIALVTLRLGAKQGLTILGLACLVLALMWWPLTGQPMSGLVVGLSLWLPSTVIAIVLWRTVSWTRALQAAIGFGAGLIVAVHVWVAEPERAWQRILELGVAPALEQSGMSPGEIETTIAQFAGVMTSLVAMSIVLSMIGSLLIARYWQAALYNPGGFREEFQELRFGLWPSLVVAAALLIGASGVQIAIELAVVILIGYFLHGLAVVHALARILGWHVGWLIGLYLLMIPLSVQIMALLAAIGAIDAFADLRTRVAASRKGGDAD